MEVTICYNRLCLLQSRQSSPEEKGMAGSRVRQGWDRAALGSQSGLQQGSRVPAGWFDRLWFDSRLRRDRGARQRDAD